MHQTIKTKPQQKKIISKDFNNLTEQRSGKLSMLKLVKLVAALAAVFSAPLAINLLTFPENGANQSVQASTSNLVLTETANVRKAFTTDQNSLLLADTSNTPEMEEKVNPTGIMLGLAAVGGVAAGVALSTKNAKSPSSSGSKTYGYSSRLSSNKEDTISIDRASRKLQKKLLRLLHDDRNTANRLISQVRFNNPNRSIDWCVEKVIYDLERDRGGY